MFHKLGDTFLSTFSEGNICSSLVHSHLSGGVKLVRIQFQVIHPSHFFHLFFHQLKLLFITCVVWNAVWTEECFRTSLICDWGLINLLAKHKHHFTKSKIFNKENTYLSVKLQGKKCKNVGVKKCQWNFNRFLWDYKALTGSERQTSAHVSVTTT